VIAAHADDLPFEDGTFDAAVASLVLCSVPDPVGALTELRRVLSPTGELRFFEHVRSTHTSLHWPRTWSPRSGPPWRRLPPHRDLAAAIRAAGFTIESLDRVTYAPIRFSPPQPHILGHARPTG